MKCNMVRAVDGANFEVCAAEAGHKLDHNFVWATACMRCGELVTQTEIKNRQFFRKDGLHDCPTEEAILKRLAGVVAGLHAIVEFQVQILQAIQQQQSQSRIEVPQIKLN